jgi:peptidoglycan LD-endopeptidase LytH
VGATSLRALLTGAVLGSLLLASFLAWSFAAGGASATRDDVDRLRGRGLQLPVAGVRPAELRDSFTESRRGHTHEAIDIAAKRGTPVLAVEAGTIEGLVRGDVGGLSVRQLDPTARYRYYYAHLDAYAPGLREGAAVRKGDVIGYVGTTGNAPEDAPHLHFAIFEVGGGEAGSLGLAVNPYPLLAPDVGRGAD